MATLLLKVSRVMFAALAGGVVSTAQAAQSDGGYLSTPQRINGHFSPGPPSGYANPETYNKAYSAKKGGAATPGQPAPTTGSGSGSGYDPEPDDSDGDGFDMQDDAEE